MFLAKFSDLGFFFVVVMSFFCAVEQFVSGCFFEAKLKSSAGCVYYRPEESGCVWERMG
jgi:hypothetical protein